MEVVEDVVEDYAEIDGWTNVAWCMDEEVEFLRWQVFLLDDSGEIDVFNEADDEVLVNEAERVMFLRVKFGIDVPVLDPGVKEGKMILLGGDEGGDELLPKRSKGLAVEGPGVRFLEDVNAVLEFMDRASDAGVFPGGGEELEGTFFDGQMVVGIWREDEGLSFG